MFITKSLLATGLLTACLSLQGVAAQAVDAPEMTADGLFTLGTVELRNAANEQRAGNNSSAERYQIKARAAFDEACGAGNKQACLSAANLYRSGIGGLQDYAKAERLYKTACTARLAEGCAALGYLNNKGRVTGTPDIAKATAYYRQACDLQSVNGCAALGNLTYVNARSTSQRNEGARLLNTTCDAGFDWSCERISLLGVARKKGGDALR